jgi:hypothetical protein
MKKIGLILMLVTMVTGGVLAEMPAGFSLSGSIDAPSTFRSKELNTFLNGGQLTTSDFMLSPLVTLDTKFETKGKVMGAIQFQNRRLAVTTGTLNPAQFGGGLNINPSVTQAYIKVSEFFSPKLAMTYGIQDLNLTLRKGEGAFFMHPAGALTPSAQMPLDLQTAFESAFFFTATSGDRAKGVSEFSGFAFDYGSVKDDNYAVNFFYGKTMETVVAAGAKRNEDLLLGANVSYKLPGENNILKVLLAQMNNASTNMSIMTFGVGADYFGAMPNLEIYGEVYNQSGTFNNNGNTAAGTPTDVDQVAMAMRLGAKYDFANNPMKPWAGFSYWSLSGGDDSFWYKNNSVKYTENNHFVSYEDSQSTLILEDQTWGLNVNSNYTAIKLEGGITTSLTLGGEKSDLDLKLLFGTFSLNSAPYVCTAGVDGFMKTADDAIAKAKKGLGTEIDIVANLHYTENLSFTLGLGMLSGSDFFGKLDVDNTNSGGTTKDSDNFDSMTLVTLGANLKF